MPYAVHVEVVDVARCSLLHIKIAYFLMLQPDDRGHDVPETSAVNRATDIQRARQSSRSFIQHCP